MNLSIYIATQCILNIVFAILAHPPKIGVFLFDVDMFAFFKSMY